MKFKTIPFAVSLFALLLFSACQNGAETTESSTEDTTLTPPADLPSDAQPGSITMNPVTSGENKPAAEEPAQNAEGVWHYTCAKGCAGGAGSAIPCATCGGTLAHNQAYHGKPAAAPAAGLPTLEGAPPVTKPEPAQNAAGVWHYTCSGGCAGGAGSASNCASCGKQLVHNQSYHN